MRVQKYISAFIIGIITLSFAISSCSDSDKGDRVTNLTVRGVKLASGKPYIQMTDNEDMKLSFFFMPSNIKEAPLSFDIWGEPTGDLTITSDGILKSNVKTPDGEFKNPLGRDTIVIRVEDGSGTYVKYPVEIHSHIVLVTSITLGAIAQNPILGPAESLDLSKYVTINPTGASEKGLIYKSDNEAAVTVSNEGVITAVGTPGQSATITIQSKDRGAVSTTTIVTLSAEATKYEQWSDYSKWTLSSNLPNHENNSNGVMNLLDDNNKTFWEPAITAHKPIAPECFLNIDFGEILDVGQFSYRQRQFGYGGILALGKFSLQYKEKESDEWQYLIPEATSKEKEHEFVVEWDESALDKYHVYPLLENKRARYLRMQLLEGVTDTDHPISLGDIGVYVMVKK